MMYRVVQPTESPFLCATLFIYSSNLPTEESAKLFGSMIGRIFSNINIFTRTETTTRNQIKLPENNVK